MSICLHFLAGLLREVINCVIDDLARTSAFTVSCRKAGILKKGSGKKGLGQRRARKKKGSAKSLGVEREEKLRIILQILRDEISEQTGKHLQIKSLSRL